MKCPECGSKIESNTTVCPSCGYPIGNEVVSERPSFSKKRRYIGLAMCLTALVCFFLCIRSITDDMYGFYLQHYDECVAGYEENIATANSYSSGFFRSSYQDIAADYQDMIDSAQKEIWTYRGKAIALGSAGLILLGFGIKKLKKEDY